ncbi:PREDICTED: voltage-dependent T-type calcium channel subunit alpha-1H-like [Bison bison bison]|uniref:Voltage-dependent T-type calcium channel subunit alpha-1H-like n=1 Tax=Bison bison bison TaxID=43346 RepID=A0A6P3HXH3_BISBB|nr:PREDICTED: voltage-dependent T-type calcium channel subunit alpha-1H-like [Bison bison bison]
MALSAGTGLALLAHHVAAFRRSRGGTWRCTVASVEPRRHLVATLRMCVLIEAPLLQAFDDFIFAFFAVEMVIKMIALGLFGQKCYLGDTWNRLDFFIVMAGMMEYSLDGHNVSLSAIRTVRVLRPLRAINRVPSMRILVTLLLDTLPMLGNVLLLCFFVFFIFGIVGVQLWAGLLRNRCFLDSTFARNSNLSFLRPYYQPEEGEENPFICSSRRDNGMQKCSHIPSRRELRVECTLGWEAYGQPQAEGAGGTGHHTCINWNQYYNVCRSGDSNPHNGAISFDNIGYAWIAIFQVITLEGWVEIMYYVMDAHSFYNFIYFILLIIVGSFFMINLCLVVIATQFSETKQRENQLMREQRARYLSNDSERARVAHAAATAAAGLKLAAGLGAMNYPTILPSAAGSGKSGLGPKGKRPGGPPGAGGHSPLRLSSPDPCEKIQHLVGEHGLGQAPSRLSGLSVPCPLPSPQRAAAGEQGGLGHVWASFSGKLRRIVDSKYFNRGIMVAILTNTLSMGVEYHEQPDELTNALEISNIVFTSMFALEMLLKLLACGPLGYIRNPYNIFDGIIVVIRRWEPGVWGRPRPHPAGLFCLRPPLVGLTFTLGVAPPRGASRLLCARRAQGDATRSDTDEDKTSTHLEEDLDKFRDLRATEMKMYSLAVTPNGHLEGRGSLPPPLIMRTAATPVPTPKSSPHLDEAPGPLDSRRGSSSSMDPQLGDQKSLSSLRSSPCAPWGPNSAWSSRRSSWNSLGRAPSLKRRSQCGERESLLSGRARQEATPRGARLALASQALMSLFVLSSKDGWVNIMYDGLDAVGVDQQPVPNHNPWMLLYFISFLLIVSFFVLNMFVGVVVENFHKCRQHQEAEEARRREEKRQRRLERKRRSTFPNPVLAGPHWLLAPLAAALSSLVTACQTEEHVLRPRRAPVQWGQLCLHLAGTGVP